MLAGHKINPIFKHSNMHFWNVDFDNRVKDLQQIIDNNNKEKQQITDIVSKIPGIL